MSIRRSFIMGFLIGIAGAALSVLAIGFGRDEPAPRQSDAARAKAVDRDGPPIIHVTPDTLSVRSMLMMSASELRKVDPVAMNLAVLREIPRYRDLDVLKYIGIVDHWADLIQRGLDAAEAIEGPLDPVYRRDPDLWRAGGMAAALAGERIGIRYTGRGLDPGDADQSFITGLIDTKQGTCATMPVLYLGIAHRLGLPMMAVVAGDHMFCRLVSDDGFHFNLEATDAESDGEFATFATPTDQEYIEFLGVPARAVAVGSDMRSLTPRQLLAVFLQQRAGYWVVHEEYDRATRDLLHAHALFPQNRDIFQFLHKILARRAGEIFSDDEYESLLHWSRFLARTARRETEKPR